MTQNIKISIVSPVYRAEKMVHMLVERIVKSVSTITEDYEIILVNDASPDASWQMIEQKCAIDKRVKGVNLSRNFGQHYAITAGLNYAKGEWVVVMDCDLQDRPEEIPALYNKAQEGYDSVFAQRVQREDTWLKRLSSKAFYAVFGYLTDTKQDPSVANYGIYSHGVIQSILQMGDHFRYFPTMVQWVGFKKAYLPERRTSERKLEEGPASTISPSATPISSTTCSSAATAKFWAIKQSFSDISQTILAFRAFQNTVLRLWVILFFTFHF